MFKFFLLAVQTAICVCGLVAVSGIEPASAAGVAMTADMQALPFERLGVYTSQPGETLRAFLLRVAPTLQAFTARTGFEACGVIATDREGGFSVVLGSNDSQIGCLAGEAGALEDATPTGETIHSHPAGSVFHLTRTDRRLAWATHARDPGARTIEASPNGFSATDYATGPGYLVAGGRLLYQHGQGTAVVVAALP